MNFIHHDRVLKMQLYFDYQMRSFLDESTTTIKQQMVTDHWFYRSSLFLCFLWCFSCQTWSLHNKQDNLTHEMTLAHFLASGTANGFGFERFNRDIPFS